MPLPPPVMSTVFPEILITSSFLFVTTFKYRANLLSFNIQYSIAFLIVKRMIKEEILRMASFMARITVLATNSFKY